eukprot:16406042-Heterocapsa_arctica.AAC.1
MSACWAAAWKTRPKEGGSFRASSGWELRKSKGLSAIFGSRRKTGSQGEDLKVSAPSRNGRKITTRKRECA